MSVSTNRTKTKAITPAKLNLLENSVILHGHQIESMNKRFTPVTDELHGLRKATEKMYKIIREFEQKLELIAGSTN